MPRLARFLFPLALLAVLPAPSCQPQPEPVPPAPPGPPPPPAVVDAGRPVPPPLPPPAPPSVGDVYDDACRALAAVPCPEGLVTSCAATMRHTDQAGLTKVPVVCLAAAKTAAQVRACGPFVGCR